MSYINSFFYEKKYRILSSSSLKVIALVTMFIDHLGAGLLLLMLRKGQIPFGLSRDDAIFLYSGIRHVGRIAFPIYCFLLTQGLKYTKSIKKYVANLCIFGIISELFFDISLQVRNDVTNTNIKELLSANFKEISTHSNVFFTLLVGLMVIYTMKYVEDNLFEGRPFYSMINNPLYQVLYFVPCVSGSLIAQYIHCDYRWWGIVLITIFFALKNEPFVAAIIGYAFFANLGGELWALPAFIFILMYNGKKGFVGPASKYVFYAFYPVHLLLIYIIRVFVMG